jgi:hypothetical protein
MGWAAAHIRHGATPCASVARGQPP